MKHKKTVFPIIFILCGLAALSGQSVAVESPDTERFLQLDRITIDKIKKEIRIQCRLAITEGVLEYLLVSDHGKTYESVFKVSNDKPSQLNFALLLIGLEPLDFNRFNDLLRTPDGVQRIITEHADSLVEITIRQGRKEVDFFQLAENREKLKTPLLWVYTGGTFLEDNRYAGDFELSHIGIWPDPTAVINLFSTSRNPYRGDYGFTMKPAESMTMNQEFEIIIQKKEAK